MWELDTVVATSPTPAPARTEVQNWDRAGVSFGKGLNNLPGNNERSGMAYWFKLAPLIFLSCANPKHNRGTTTILALASLVTLLHTGQTAAALTHPGSLAPSLTPDNKIRIWREETAIMESREYMLDYKHTGNILERILMKFKINLINFLALQE